MELAYSKPESFEIDEPYDDLGARFQLPPQFEDRRDELRGALERLDTGR